MNQYTIHILLSLAYFLIPALAMFSGSLESIQGIGLNVEVLSSLKYYLIFSLFGVVIVASFVRHSLNRKIQWAKVMVGRMSFPYASLALFMCVVGLLFYAVRIGINIDADMSRDERFALLESSISPVFILLIKVGSFLSALSIVQGVKKNALFFVIVVAIVTFSTLSRSLLGVVLVSLVPFFLIRKSIAIAGLIFIFLSRWIFTNNFEFSLDWLFTFGVGEMIGVTFGPYVFLAKEHSISIYQHLLLMANAIPGISLVSRIDGSVPELTIFANKIVENEYGIYGVAGTVYLDWLVSKPVFFLCVAVLLLIYFFIRFSERKAMISLLVFCIYFSSCLSVLMLYRWSLSGYVYSVVRDAALFFVLAAILNKPSNKRYGIKDVRN